jgi:hypothetical protein
VPETGFYFLGTYRRVGFRVVAGIVHQKKAVENLGSLVGVQGRAA